MERQSENNDMQDAHDENRQSESESLRKDLMPEIPDTEQKKDGTTSAFSAATGGNTGNEEAAG